MAPFASNISQNATNATAPGLSSEAFITAGAVLPILAYPFLPSDGYARNWCGLLCWTSLPYFFFIHGLNALTWGFGGPAIFHLQFWMAPLNWCTTMAGLHGGLGAYQQGREPEREDFVAAANGALAIAPWTLLWFGWDYVFANDMASLWNVACVLAGATGVVVVIVVVYGALLDSATTVCYHLATRRVRWWCWLPENGAENDFVSNWNVVLVIVVIVSAPILLIGAWRVSPALMEQGPAHHH
jgi:hypothetical protein